MFGFPGGSLGRDDGLGGRGGIGLPADRGVPARAGEDGPENIKSGYYHTVNNAKPAIITLKSNWTHKNKAKIVGLSWFSDTKNFWPVNLDVIIFGNTLVLPILSIN